MKEFKIERAETLTPEELEDKFTELENAIKSLVEKLNEDDKTSVPEWADYIGVNLFEQKEMFSNDLYDDDVEETVIVLNEFMERYKDHEGKRTFRVEMDSNIYVDEYSCYLESICYKASWLEPTSFEKIQERQLSVIKRNFISKLLIPHGDICSWDVRTPDCTLLELFKNGTIDWGTLRTLTYKDCEV